MITSMDIPNHALLVDVWVFLNVRIVRQLIGQCWLSCFAYLEIVPFRVVERHLDWFLIWFDDVGNDVEISVDS